MTQEATFRFRLCVPRQVRVEARSLSRELFYGWLWDEFGARGLLGVHEGTLLSEDAAKAGLETESWTIDAGEAPRERDWVEGQALEEAELYFATPEQAEAARGRLGEIGGLALGPVEKQEAEDWDAQWKAAFLSSPTGLRIEPFWRIVPAWLERDSESGPKAHPGEIPLRINPGAGFGTGTHETTQLCLEAIALEARRLGAGGPRPLAGLRALDFGSGSGILSIGAALLGARVDGVEIDPLAIDNAHENSRLNDVEGSVSYTQKLPRAGEPYPLVIANILKPVLLEFAPELCARLAPRGSLVLSGLMEGDVREVSERFTALLRAGAPRVRELGEWRALVWQKQ